MTYYTRAQWGARHRRSHPGSLTSVVEGIALHWPAMSGKVQTVNGAMAALRGWQNFHMNDRGWSDIAYQEAVDQLGNVYELRGLANRSAANGDTSTNGRFGALLLILGPGEHPTEEMLTSVRARIARHRELFPGSRRIVGHGQIRAGGTTCPGPITQGLIDAGAFEPRVAAPEPLTRGKFVDATIRKLQRRAKRQAEDKPKRARKFRKAAKRLMRIKPR